MYVKRLIYIVPSRPDAPGRNVRGVPVQLWFCRNVLFAVSLGIVINRRGMLNAQTVSDACKEFRYELWSALGQHLGP